jgi:hypothetical protein
MKIWVKFIGRKNTKMENVVEVASDRKLGQRLAVVGLAVVACVPAFAQTAPVISVDYGSFGTEVVKQIQSMLTAVLPAAAVLFGTLKGISWVRGIL